jgi:hypothetical protein
MDKKTITIKSQTKSLLVLTGQKRLLLLRNIRGMWKNHKTDPIKEKELEKIRREWEREHELEKELHAWDQVSNDALLNMEQAMLQ